MSYVIWPIKLSWNLSLDLSRRQAKTKRQICHLSLSDSKNGAHLTWWVTILYSNLYQLMQNDQKLGKMILNLTELRPKSFGTKLNLTELGQHFLEPN